MFSARVNSRTRGCTHTCNLQIKMEVRVKSAESENHKEKKHRKRKQKEKDYKGDVDILSGAVVKKFSSNLALFIVVCGIKCLQNTGTQT